MNITIASLEQTEKLAAACAKILRPGTVIALNGELGAGKTTFTKALVRASGGKDTATSPTFVLLNIYQGGLYPVYHFDFYRLASLADLENIGGPEFIPPPSGVAVIEWAEKIPDILPADHISVNIAVEDEERRIFSFSFLGQTQFLQKELERQWLS
ncbi:MAG: tRNA (adenosine(37)-N6)-threonylcarbamoyltransferase complex ATPase subunit type 1 TsaE [Candidatus Margulisbacteria bacterium]|jgi:tRNA threonylcarbamoyladenosine biosynthesis protein TsaE|nr:tRNA (adenosine(37)-N6)-threonylcarbamoyltransferase complex ATPase subunit type 1 TsaE [Candidatus Margulisiibacteriota bacterium]